MLSNCRNLDEFKKFVKSITIYSGVGGDSAEDVFGGLETVSKLSWRRDGTKVRQIACMHVSTVTFTYTYAQKKQFLKLTSMLATPQHKSNKRTKNFMNFYL